MTSESKILTVSYGTFSCTLEGFDDPFNTMKAVAEYFRDLAAEDRYFGSEPPVPDAAMLHRIAEREVQRMVEARVQDHGVFLRQQEAAAKAPTAPLPSVAPAPPASLTEALAPEQASIPPEPAVVPADADADDGTAPILQDIIPGGVAAKLARIRQSVNVAGRAAPAASDVSNFAPPAHAEPEAEPEADATAALDDSDAYLLDVVTAPVEHDVKADTAEVEEALSRLLSLSDEVASEDDLADLNALAATTAEDIAVPDEIAMPEVEAVADADAEGDIPQWLAHDDGSDDDLAASTLDDLEVLAPDEIAALSEETSKAEDMAQPQSAPADFSTTDDEPAEPETFAPAHEIDAEKAETASEAFVLTPALLLNDTVEDDPETPISAAEAVDSLPEDKPEDPDAELAAALANTVAQDAKAGKSKRTNSRMLRPRNDDKNAPDAAAPESSQDLDVDRLLRQADDEMADVDNRRRLSAIAHLKAAVAATEAERAVTGEAMNPPGAKIEPYRDDLAQVVQPLEPEPEPPVKPRRKSVTIRPQEPRPGTIRPGMVGPAPLVLVSEQRIDRTPPTGQPVVAVRSGRLSGSIGAGASGQHPPPNVQMPRPAAAPVISSDREDEDEDTDDNIFVNEAGFSDFAEKVGVKSLADMLEAAAAYATCMERRDQFTRPQLMRRLIASAAGKPVSREEGLRSFGTLLRTGRIEKVSRGHYSLPDNSPYLAEARRIAN